jgi:hypothetical protein
MVEVFVGGGTAFEALVCTYAEANDEERMFIPVASAIAAYGAEVEETRNCYHLHEWSVCKRPIPPALVLPDNPRREG